MALSNVKAAGFKFSNHEKEKEMEKEKENENPLKNNPLTVKITRSYKKPPTPVAHKNAPPSTPKTDDVFDVLGMGMEDNDDDNDNHEENKYGVNLGLDTKDYLGTFDSNPFFMDREGEGEGEGEGEEEGTNAGGELSSPFDLSFGGGVWEDEDGEEGGGGGDGGWKEETEDDRAEMKHIFANLRASKVELEKGKGEFIAEIPPFKKKAEAEAEAEEADYCDDFDEGGGEEDSLDVNSTDVAEGGGGDGDGYADDFDEEGEEGGGGELLPSLGGEGGLVPVGELSGRERGGTEVEKKPLPSVEFLREIEELKASASFLDMKFV